MMWLLHKQIKKNETRDDFGGKFFFPPVSHFFYILLTVPLAWWGGSGWNYVFIFITISFLSWFLCFLKHFYTFFWMNFLFLLCCVKMPSSVINYFAVYFTLSYLYHVKLFFWWFFMALCGRIFVLLILKGFSGGIFLC